MTDQHPQRHEQDGYTIAVYFPPTAPWDAVEAFFDRAATDAYSITREGWDPFVVGRAGDLLASDSEPEEQP